MQALDVCRNAKDFGLAVTLVATGEGNLEDEFRKSGANFIKLKRKLPVDLNLVRQIRRIIINEGIRIVHGYQAVEGLNLYLATLGLKNVKRVLSFQGFIADSKNRLVSKFLITRNDANVYVSEGLRNWLSKVDKFDTKKKAHVIFNGADRKRILSENKVLRRELNLGDSDLIFGMVANFYRDKRKDQMTICRALPEIFEKKSNAHCVFVGRTEKGAEHKFQEAVRFCKEKGISKRVHFLGGRHDIPNVLASLDLFVFSTFQEGLPVAVTEAMLAKVPMILSDIEPMREVSNNGEFGELFELENEKDLAAKVIRHLGDENLRKSSAMKNLIWAEDNFSIEAHLKKLTNLYSSLIE